MVKPSEFVAELKKSRQNSPIKDNISEAILKDCVRMIKETNALGYTSFTYIIPPFMYGMPLYDISLVAAKIRKELLKKGLKVTAVDLDKLSISW